MEKATSEIEKSNVFPINHTGNPVEESEGGTKKKPKRGFLKKLRGVVDEILIAYFPVIVLTLVGLYLLYVSATLAEVLT